jgi:hypothetical protein
MGLLTRHRYRVVVPYHMHVTEEFETLADARAYARQVARAGLTATVYRARAWPLRDQVIPDEHREPPENGGVGVREPRRPRPGASSDGIALPVD